MFFPITFALTIVGTGLAFTYGIFRTQKVADPDLLRNLGVALLLCVGMLGIIAFLLQQTWWVVSGQDARVNFAWMLACCGLVGMYEALKRDRTYWAMAALAVAEILFVLGVPSPA
jgi:hypothetical protein